MVYKTYAIICIRIYILEVDDHWKNGRTPLDEDKFSIEKWWFVNQPSNMVAKDFQGTTWYMRISHSCPTCFKHPLVPSGWLWVRVDSSGFDKCDGWSLAYAMLILSLNIRRCLVPPNKPIKDQAWGGMTGCLGSWMYPDPNVPLWEIPI